MVWTPTHFDIPGYRYRFSRGGVRGGGELATIAMSLDDPMIDPEALLEQAVRVPVREGTMGALIVLLITAVLNERIGELGDAYITLAAAELDVQQRQGAQAAVRSQRFHLHKRTDIDDLLYDIELAKARIASRLTYTEIVAIVARIEELATRARTGSLDMNAAGQEG